MGIVSTKTISKMVTGSLSLVVTNFRTFWRGECAEGTEGGKVTDL